MRLLPKEATRVARKLVLTLACANVDQERRRKRPMAVTFKIQIAAPPERAFDELSHVERHPSWANPVAQMKMEQTAGEGPGPTSRYRSSGLFVKKPVSADISVTAYEPP